MATRSKKVLKEIADKAFEPEKKTKKATPKKKAEPKGYTTTIPLAVQIYTTTKPTKKQIQELTATFCEMFQSLIYSVYDEFIENKKKEKKEVKKPAAKKVTKKTSRKKA